MKKIQVWANFCPKKYYWELKQLPTFSDLPENWWENTKLLKEQLKLLKKAGITGLRLNIFNSELTTNAQTIHWQPLETFLDLAEQLQLEIHLCVGPYQYPLWPGIRFPEAILTDQKVSKVLDQNKKWREFGIGFLEVQLKRYGKHKIITGFYLGNEWHTTQRIEDFVKKNDPFSVSQKHMESLARLCKKLTRKPIIFNTNLQPFQHKRLEFIFLSLIKILKNQSWIGFDIYASQESIFKSPGLFMYRKMHTYSKDIDNLKKKFIPRITISEFEAQPWGDGKSWYSQITASPKIIANTAIQLEKTFKTFLSVKQFDAVTLWGAEFWLIAYHLGHTDMLDTIQKLDEVER